MDDLGEKIIRYVERYRVFDGPEREILEFGIQTSIEIGINILVSLGLNVAGLVLIYMTASYVI